MKKKQLTEYALITAACLLYAVSTHFFIFPHNLLLGGTSGISVILNAFLPMSAGKILTMINLLLLGAAFLVLGKQLAGRTLVGTLITTFVIGVLDVAVPVSEPIIGNLYISSIAGAGLIAVASGVLFYEKASSGGTDILALIVRKYSSLDIGKALLITDVLIVIVGGVLSGAMLAVSSFIGLLVKTLGIDLVIEIIKRKAS